MSEDQMKKEDQLFMVMENKKDVFQISMIVFIV